MNKIQVAYLQLLKKLLSGNSSKMIKIFDGNLKGYLWNFTKNTNNEYILGIYEQENLELLFREINRGNVVYDIGAHFGYVACTCGEIVEKDGMVYAIEAMPSNYNILSTNIKANKIKNIKAFHFALSDKKDVVNFSDTENSVANTYIDSSPMHNSGKTVAVNAITLDSLIEENQLLPPNFLKIDVEGAEYDVLMGAKKTISNHFPKILLSTHNNQNKGVEEKCLQFLKEHGYVIKEERPHGHSPLMKEFLFVKNG